MGWRQTPENFIFFFFVPSCQSDWPLTSVQGLWNSREYRHEEGPSQRGNNLAIFLRGVKQCMRRVTPAPPLAASDQPDIRINLMKIHIWDRQKDERWTFDVGRSFVSFPIKLVAFQVSGSAEPQNLWTLNFWTREHLRHKKRQRHRALPFYCHQLLNHHPQPSLALPQLEHDDPWLNSMLELILNP